MSTDNKTGGDNMWFKKNKNQSPKSKVVYDNEKLTHEIIQLQYRVTQLEYMLEQNLKQTT